MSVARVVRARRRVARRRLRDEAYALGVLAPIILGGSLWIGERGLSTARDLCARLLSSAPQAVEVILALTVAAALHAGTRRELFGREHDLLDALPVREIDRAGAALVIVCARAAAPAFAVLAAAWFLAPAVVDPRWGVWIGLAALGAAAAAILDLLIVLLLARARLLRTEVVVAGGAALLLALSVEALAPLLTPWRWAGRPLRRLMDEALAIVPTAAPASGSLDPWTAGFAVVGLSIVGSLAVFGTRRSALERVQAADRPRRLPIDGLLRPLGMTSRALLVRRDLRLVLRRFSPVVGLATLAVGVALAATASLAADPLPNAPVGWALRAPLAPLALAALAAASLVPFLIREQLPLLWIEKSLGVAPRTVWLAKATLTAVLAAGPAIFGAALIAGLGGGEAIDRVLAAALGLLVMVAVAGTVGLASYEIASQPMLGLLLGGLFGLAIAGLLIVYPRAWWLWMGLWGYVASQLAGRADRQVEIAEEAA
ncbi:MAG: hypothetical protein AAGN46_08900 [Acidobacteriota bacterium]